MTRAKKTASTPSTASQPPWYPRSTPQDSPSSPIAATPSSPAGVSCVCVILESHISFHTWSEEGVVTLDLFTCGDNPLLPVVPKLEKLFGVPKSKDQEAE